MRRAILRAYGREHGTQLARAHVSEPIASQHVTAVTCSTQAVHEDQYVSIVTHKAPRHVNLAHRRQCQPRRPRRSHRSDQAPRERLNEMCKYEHHRTVVRALRGKCPSAASQNTGSVDERLRASVAALNVNLDVWDLAYFEVELCGCARFPRAAACRLCP